MFLRVLPLPQVIFSDEKRFCLYNDGPIRVWRKRIDKYKQDCVRGQKKFSKSIMMHLAIKYNGQTRLTRCTNRQDSQSYQDNILTPNLNFIRRVGAQDRRNPIVFQQDGASCHTSRSTERFLANHRVDVLQNWPANSPDLNPVEHCWSWLARKLVGQKFDTEDALEKAVRDAWATRPPTLIPHLYASMVRRLTAVLVKRGGPTKY